MTSSDEPAAGKVCTKCSEWKPWEGFSRDSRSLSRGGDGHVPQCKTCAREYREANRDRIATRKREYRAKNRNRISEQKREYREQNRDWITERKREWREANRDRIAEHHREYRVAKRHDPQYRAQLKASKLRRRALKRSLPSEMVLLREIALRDDATCWMCGDELSEWNPAHLDHLVPLSADTDQLAAWSLDNPGTVRANMALACPSCNIRKSNRIMPCALARYLRNLSAESESLDEAC